MNKHPGRTSACLIAWAVAPLLVGLAGCKGTPDCITVVPADQVTTPSVDAAYAQTPRRSNLVRNNDVFAVASVGGSVSHGFLYFEDPLTQATGPDEHQGITLGEYRQCLCRPGRFLCNLVFFPLQAGYNWVVKPGTYMVSDGELSRRCPGEMRDPACVVDYFNLAGVIRHTWGCGQNACQSRS